MSVDFNMAADKLCNIYTNFNTLLDQIPHLHRRAFGTARKSCVKDKHKFLITDIKLVVHPKRVVLIGFFMCFFLPHFHILVQKHAKVPSLGHTRINQNELSHLRNF